MRVNTTTVTRPAQQLGGFHRIDLSAGEQTQIAFDVDATQLAYTNLDRDLAVEPARIDVFVGLDSDDRALNGSFAVTGQARILDGADRSFLSTASSTSACSAPGFSTPSASASAAVSL